MKEARVFFRFVIPGIVFAIALAALSWLLQPKPTGHVFKYLLNNATAGSVIGAILASGGLGALFSTIHHAWHGRSGGRYMDHRQVLKRLVTEGIIEIQGTDVNTISREQAWVIVTAVWHERTGGLNELIKSSDKATMEICDLFHSTGTSLVAIISAIILAFLLVVTHGHQEVHCVPALRLLAAAILAGAAYRIFQFNHRRVAKKAVAVVDQCFADAMWWEHRKNGKVTTRPLFPMERTQ